jgi:hypothetical protein
MKEILFVIQLNQDQLLFPFRV